MKIQQRFTACTMVSAHEEMNPLARDTMEDTLRIVDGFNGDAKTGYFAVFDGHGGREVSQFLQTALDQNLEKELNLPDDATVEERIRRAFLITDIQCLQRVKGSSGSTALMCLVTGKESKKTIYCGNAGDRYLTPKTYFDEDSSLIFGKMVSRAVLYSNGMAKRLSHDHKTDDPNEINRIGLAGGCVIRERVLGVLAITRSFGDFGLKKYVIADPYLSTTLVDASEEPCFLILACDGVWDVLTDEEACEIVRRYNPTCREKVAQVLVEEAIGRGSTDNVTVIIAFF